MANRVLAVAARRHVGVVLALAAEARALGVVRPAPGVLGDLLGETWILLGGIGPDAARRAAQVLVDAGVHALAVFGVAGALAPGLRSGSLICPKTVLDEDGAHHAVDGSWRARLVHRLEGLKALASGTLLSVRAPLLSPAAKAAAQAQWRADAVDMESAAVAEVAAAHGLPLLVLRAIADEAQDAIPAALAGAVDAYGRARPGAMLGALIREPMLLARLPRLAMAMNRAGSSLRAAVRLAGSDLACNEPRSGA